MMRLLLVAVLFSALSSCTPLEGLRPRNQGCQQDSPYHEYDNPWSKSFCSSYLATTVTTTSTCTLGVSTKTVLSTLPDVETTKTVTSTYTELLGLTSPNPTTTATVTITEMSPSVSTPIKKRNNYPPATISSVCSCLIPPPYPTTTTTIATSIYITTTITVTVPPAHTHTVTATSTSTKDIIGIPIFPATSTVTVTATATAINELVNPGFETGALPPWTTFGAIPFDVVAHDAEEGMYAAHLPIKPPNRAGSSFIQQSLAVQIGIPYTFSVYAKATDSSQFQLTLYCADGMGYAGAPLNLPFGQDLMTYTKVSTTCTFRTSPGTVAVVISDSSASDADVYIDNLVLAPA